MKKALVAGTAAMALTTLFAGPVAAAPKSANQPQLITDEVSAVMAGTPTWVNVLWVADGDVDNVSVAAKSKDVDIAYSPTTGDHAGPMNGYALSDLEADFTALNITVPEDFNKKSVKIELTVSWTNPDGKTDDKKVKINVPVVHYQGDKDWQLVDDGASHVSGWVEIPVVGLAPAAEDLRFWLADSGGVDVYLPQGEWTGPHHDNTLVTGESDVFRFYVEPDAVPADHPIALDATWIRNGVAKSETITFTVRSS